MDKCGCPPLLFPDLALVCFFFGSGVMTVLYNPKGECFNQEIFLAFLSDIGVRFMYGEEKGK